MKNKLQQFWEFLQENAMELSIIADTLIIVFVLTSILTHH